MPGQSGPNCPLLPLGVVFSPFMALPVILALATLLGYYNTIFFSHE